MQRFALTLTCLTHLAYSQQGGVKSYENLHKQDVQLARLLLALNYTAAFQHPIPRKLCSKPSRSDSFYLPTVRSHSTPCMASITDTLTGRNRRALRFQAGRLITNKSLVYVQVVDPEESREEVDLKLRIHEMVRIKFVTADCKKVAKEQAEELAELVDAAVAQNLGMTALLWRPSGKNRFLLDHKPLVIERAIRKAGKAGVRDVFLGVGERKSLDTPKTEGKFAREADPNEEITTIFLHNLPLDIGEEQVKRECEALGNVAQVLVIKRGRKGSGAYVRFETLGEAMDAMERINWQKVQLGRGWESVTAGPCKRNVQP